jgi:hypothetical protein
MLRIQTARWDRIFSRKTFAAIMKRWIIRFPNRTYKKYHSGTGFAVSVRISIREVL